MVDQSNLFTGLDKINLDLIEELLSDIYKAGEWEDRHEELLKKWRSSQGEAAMSSWLWWADLVDSESYSFHATTRQKAIDDARAGHLGSDEFGDIEVIEARTWQDVVKEGEEITPFAATRNKSRVPLLPGANDA
jgi:hypothetical protein